MFLMGHLLKKDLKNIFYSIYQFTYCSMINFPAIYMFKNAKKSINDTKPHLCRGYSEGRLYYTLLHNFF